MSAGSGGGGGGGNLPARRVSNAELEAVIRRAVELQAAREQAAGDPDGVSEAEVIRIGTELGLDAAAVRQAIAEVRVGPATRERGLAVALMGEGVVRASRILRRPAAEVRMFVEQYLTSAELMVVQRRFPDRTRYVKAQGVAASVARAVSALGQKQAGLGLDRVDVGVAALDEETSVIELSRDSTAERGQMLWGGVAGGAATGSLLPIFALVTPAPDLIALMGVPIFGGFLGLMRGTYRGTLRSTQERMESFLDRLEHGELRLPPAGGRGPEWRRTLGI